MDFRLERACYNVYNSDYILEFIIQHLDLQEQVKLLTVSKRFAYILSTFLWPKNFVKINLYKTCYVNIIASQDNTDNQRGVRNWNEIRQSKVALSHKECNDFLTRVAKHVKVLTVHSEYYLYEKEVGVCFKNTHFFTNLTELSYYRLILNDEQMQILCRKCKKLQKLHLIECYNEYLTPLVPGEHLNFQNICEMKNLEELIIQCSLEAECVIKSYHIKKIFLNLKLKKLILKNFTINDNDAGLTLPMADTLEVLDLGLISMRFWPAFLHYLQHFQLLKELIINVSDCNTTINIQLVDILANKCKLLERLTLEKCDLSIEDFGVLKSLKHLSLNACGGLTFANFQQILGALTLKTFALINTRIFGVINHVYISSSLEEMTIDTIRFTHISDAFQKSLNTFESLHTLRWLNGDINDDWIIEKCPKLQYLHIPNPYLLRRIVFTMKSLKELSFSSCKGLSWCFILILIRNLTLERLCLQTNEKIDDSKEIPSHACGMKTTLKMIIMPISIFKAAQSFWIDLLSRNEEMRFYIYGKYADILNGIFLEELISDEKFYSRVKHLDICGFKFDRIDLQDNLSDCMLQLLQNTSHIRTKNEEYTLQM